MKLKPFQREAVRVAREQNFGILGLLWRRQSGKTLTFSWQSTRWMLQHPGCLVTYASCSLSVGAELTEREVQMLNRIVEAMRQNAAGDALVSSTGDNLPWYDVADLFSRNKLEVSLHHSRTVASRTKIIAPNYATARGFSGFVILDEVGFIRDFKLFYEAVEPIFSTNPDFRLWMATTPPADDNHYSYELLAPEPGAAFDVNARGNWYDSQAGIPVHRVSAEDAAAAGWMFHHPRTRAKISPAEHRLLAFDKDAWDRNYALAFPKGGSAAVQLLWLHSAMAKGREEGCRFYEDDLPHDWLPRFTGGVIGVGVDPATTEGEKSNPFAIAVTEHTLAGDYCARMVFRFHSADPAKCKAYLREIAGAVRPRAMALDATSERFWCAEVKEELQHLCPVLLVVSSEVTEYMGEKMKVKTYLGNLAVNAFEDRRAALPNDPRIKADMRLVRREKGGFNNDVDSSGNHGDTFDAFKLAVHAIVDDSTIFELAAVGVMTQAKQAGHAAGRLTAHPENDDDDGGGNANGGLYA